MRTHSESAIFQAERDPALRAKYRTECWLERCVFSSTLIPADAHPSFSPLPCAAVGGGVVLSLSGLEPGELCWTRRLARALGLTVAPNFSRRTHFLLCPAGAGTKFEKAREWGVPVVGVAWLAELTRTGEMPSEGHFLIGPGGVPLPAPEPHPELQSVQEEEPESLLACGPEPESSPDLRLQYPSKGKGKQLALEGSQLGISDITNGTTTLSPFARV
jgi:DNA replication regulator DPB11